MSDDDDGIVRRHGNSWRAQWAAARIDFLKVRPGREGLFCEALLYYRNQTGVWMCEAGPTRLNLLSLGRNGTIDALKVRVPQVNWVDLVHQAGAIVARQWSEPPPLVRIADIADTGPVAFLIPGLVLESETSMIYGDGASAKSLMALLISVCVASGTPLPWGMRPSRRARVLYADWETTDATIARRARRICAGLGIAVPSELLYIGSNTAGEARVLRSLADEVDMLRGMCSEQNIGLFVADSVGFMTGRGTLSDDDLARAMMVDLRQLGGLTRLAVHHIARQDPQAPHKRIDPFGSIYFRNGVRSGFEIHKVDEMSLRDRMHVIVRQHKINDAPLLDDFALEVRFEGDTGPISFQTVGMREVQEVAEPGLGAQVLDVLRQGDATCQKVAFVLGRAEDVVRTTMNRLARAGLVMQARPGVANQPAVWRIKDVSDSPSVSDVPEPFRRALDDPSTGEVA